LGEHSGLLKRGDLIADFFCGSRTTAAVAEKLDRRWIGVELGKVGIQVSRARLVEMGARPFLIENIGNYQREMIYLSGGRINEMLNIILKLFGATPRKDYQGLGVRRSNVAADLAPGKGEVLREALREIGRAENQATQGRQGRDHDGPVALCAFRFSR
jgi:hypothetical protein